MDDGDDLDVGALLRAARRRADLSQRELAERARVAQPFVARIESGAVGNPSFRTVQRLLRSAGATLGLLTTDGLTPDVPARPPAQDGWRDQAGRHCPAHLDVTETRPDTWWGAWWATS